MNLNQHIVEHAALGIQADAGAQIADTIKNVRGFAIIDMDNDDYQMSAEESLATSLIVVNTGDGTKTLTLTDSENNPGSYSVVNFLNDNPFVFEGASSTVAVFLRSSIQYAYDTGFIDMEPSPTIVNDAVEVTTAANTDEQIIKQILLPQNSLEKNGDCVELFFAMTKSDVATTENLRLRVGDAGTVADTQAWYNVQLATTNDAIFVSVVLMRYSETAIRIITKPDASSPYGAHSSITSDITVANLGTALNYITLTGQNSTGAETVTCRSFNANLRR